MGSDRLRTRGHRFELSVKPMSTTMKVKKETEPHKITIPERPWLEPGVNKGNEDYIKLIEEGIANDLGNDTILNQVGAVAQARAQKEIVDVKTPPNAPSTIRKKGSSNPLIDSGAMRQSVHFSLDSTLPDEGLD